MKPPILFVNGFAGAEIEMYPSVNVDASVILRSVNLRSSQLVFLYLYYEVSMWKEWKFSSNSTRIYDVLNDIHKIKLDHFGKGWKQNNEVIGLFLARFIHGNFFLTSSFLLDSGVFSVSRWWRKCEEVSGWDPIGLRPSKRLRLVFLLNR